MTKNIDVDVGPRLMSINIGDVFFKLRGDPSPKNVDVDVLVYLTFHRCPQVNKGVLSSENKNIYTYTSI